MFQNLKRKYVRNFATLVANPLNIGWAAYIWELLVLDLELGIVTSQTALKSEKLQSLYQLSKTTPFNIFGMTDPQNILLRIGNTTAIWIILVGVLVLLILLILKFFQLRSRDLMVDEGEEQRSQKVKRTLNSSSFLRSVVYNFEYISYFLLSFIFSFFLCTSNKVLKFTMMRNDILIIILPTGASAFDNTTEYVTEMKWLYDDSKCFDGNYFVIFSLATMMLVSSLTIYGVSLRIANFYTSPEVSQASYGYSKFAHPLAFFIMMASQRLLLMFGATNLMGVYYALSLGAYIAVIACISVLTPYYDATLAKVKLLKAVIVAYSIAYVIEVRSYPSLEEASNKTSIMYMATLTLLVVSLVYRLFLLLLEYRYSTPLELVAVADTSYSTLCWMVYKFYELKSLLASKTLDMQRALSKDEICIVIAFGGLISQHTFELARFKNKFEQGDVIYDFGLDQNAVKLQGNEQLAMEDIVFIINKILHGCLEKGITYEKDAGSEKTIQLFKLWAAFNLNLEYKVHQVAIVMKQVRCFLEAKQTKDKKESTLPLDFLVIEQLFNLKYTDWLENSVEYTLAVQAGVNLRPKVATRFKTKYKPSISSDNKKTATFTERLDFYRMVDFNNNFTELDAKIRECVDTKTKMLMLLQEPLEMEKLFNTAKLLRRQCTEANSLIVALSKMSRVTYQRLIVLKILFYRDITEDLIRGKRSFAEAKQNNVTEDQGIVFAQERGTKSKSAGQVIYVAVSGEKETLETVTYCSQNISILEFSSQTFIGESLSLIMPNCVKAFHKELIESELNDLNSLVTKDKLNLGVRSAKNFLIGADLVSRINPRIDKGLEYVSAIMITKTKDEFNREDQLMSVVLDSSLKVVDVNEFAATVMTPNKRIDVLPSEIMELLQILCYGMQVKKLGLEESKALEVCSVDPTLDVSDWDIMFEDSLQVIKPEVRLPVTLALASNNTTILDDQVEKEFLLKVSCFIFPVQQKQFVRLELQEWKNDDIFELRKARTGQSISNHNFNHQFSASPSLGPSSFPKIHRFESKVTSLKRTLTVRRSVIEPANDPQPLQPSRTLDSQAALKNKPLPSHAKRQTQISRFTAENTTKEFQIKVMRAEVLEDIPDEGEEKAPEALERISSSKSRMIDKDIAKDFDLNFEQSIASSVATTRNAMGALMKHSRFIHHNIDFRGIRQTVFLFIAPLVLLLLVIGGLALYESMILKKFVNVKYELKTLDAAQYASWASILEFHYMEFRRMLGNRMIEVDTYAKFGKPNISAHATGLLESPNMAYQIFSNTMRTYQLISVSKYRSWYPTETLNSIEIEILRYDNPQEGFKLEPMKPYSAIQYVQNIFDKFVLEDIQTMVDLGGSDEKARKSFPLEEVVRYNVLNPLHRYIFYCKVSITSDEHG